MELVGHGETRMAQSEKTAASDGYTESQINQVAGGAPNYNWTEKKCLFLLAHKGMSDEVCGKIIGNTEAAIKHERARLAACFHAQYSHIPLQKCVEVFGANPTIASYYALNSKPEWLVQEKSALSVEFLRLLPEKPAHQPSKSKKEKNVLKIKEEKDGTGGKMELEKDDEEVIVVENESAVQKIGSLADDEGINLVCSAILCGVTIPELLGFSHLQPIIIKYYNGFSVFAESMGKK